jgi:hypothetical protein
MPDESDPPRKHYQLKPKEFEVVNERLRTTPPTDGTSAPDPGIVRPDQGPIDVRELAKLGTPKGPLLSANQAANRANEVHAMLQDNLAKANAAGLNDLEYRPKKKSRRKRHYWLLVAIVNPALLTVAIAAGPSNAIPFVCALAGVGMFNATWYWIMWQLVEDY